MNLASYAVRSGECGGRAHREADQPLRNPFELDRHRIIESTAFRRLEGKTQVFAPSHHDHFRTRLTHTIEASQIARCLAMALGANESLTEAITFAHDLGHPPFGHAGESALNEAMAGHGGFNHNVHSLRVVEYLEHPFPAFRGLNLTAETRAGMLVHATRYDTPGKTARHLCRSEQGAAGSSPQEAAHSVEAQIASVADRIAYNCHDLEDAIGAEFVGLQELASLTLWQEAYEQTARAHNVMHIHAIRRPALDAVVDGLLADVISTSRGLLATVGSVQEVRVAAHCLVTPSCETDAQLRELEEFLIRGVYQHPEVVNMDAEGRRMVLALFDAYRADPRTLPGRFASRIKEQGLDRVICDYIAGMTDRFCTAGHSRLVQP